MTNIVLLSITVTTNLVPGFYSAQPVSKPGNSTVNAIAIWHPTKTVITTNYHIGFWNGTNAVQIKVLTNESL